MYRVLLCLQISYCSFTYANNHIQQISKHTSSDDYITHAQISTFKFRKYLNFKV